MPEDERTSPTVPEGPVLAGGAIARIVSDGSSAIAEMSKDTAVDGDL